MNRARYVMGLDGEKKSQLKLAAVGFYSLLRNIVYNL